MVGRKIKWTGPALKDKLAIFNYWTEVNMSPVFSKKLEGYFNQAVRIAAIFPSLGKPTNAKNVRILFVKYYKIFYRETSTSIEILRIWDGRRHSGKCSNQEKKGSKANENLKFIQS